MSPHQSSLVDSKTPERSINRTGTVTKRMVSELRYAGGVALLVGVVAARAGSAPSRDFLIEPGKVGNLSVGMRVSAIVKLYPQWAVRGGFVYGEGIASPVIEIRLIRGQKDPSISIALDETTDHRFTIARGIDVLDPRFRTTSGIGPGSTVSNLRTAISDLTIGSLEGNTILNSKVMQMSFEIQDDALLYDEDGQFKLIVDIPGKIPVVSVWVY
jgi:hypothetical protein